MASLYTFKYPDGTRGREIRYRNNGKQLKHRFQKGVTAQQANIDLGTFQEALLGSKRTGKPFVNPLTHPKKNIFTIAEFMSWFFDNKKTVIGRNREIAPGSLETYDYAFQKLIEAIGKDTFCTY